VLLFQESRVDFAPDLLRNLNRQNVLSRFSESLGDHWWKRTSKSVQQLEPGKNRRARRHELAIEASDKTASL